MQKFQENFKRLLANTPENITKLFNRHHDEPSEYDDYIRQIAINNLNKFNDAD